MNAAFMKRFGLRFEYSIKYRKSRWRPETVKRKTYTRRAIFDVAVARATDDPGVEIIALEQRVVYPWEPLQ